MPPIADTFSNRNIAIDIYMYEYVYIGTKVFSSDENGSIFCIIVKTFAWKRLCACFFFFPFPSFFFLFFFFINLPGRIIPPRNKCLLYALFVYLYLVLSEKVASAQRELSALMKPLKCDLCNAVVRFLYLLTSVKFDPQLNEGSRTNKNDRTFSDELHPASEIALRG